MPPTQIVAKFARMPSRKVSPVVIFRQKIWIRAPPNSQSTSMQSAARRMYFPCKDLRSAPMFLVSLQKKLAHNPITVHSPKHRNPRVIFFRLRDRLKNSCIDDSTGSFQTIRRLRMCLICVPESVLNKGISFPKNSALPIIPPSLKYF